MILSIHLYFNKYVVIRTLGILKVQYLCHNFLGNILGNLLRQLLKFLLIKQDDFASGVIDQVDIPKAYLIIIFLKKGNFQNLSHIIKSSRTRICFIFIRHITVLLQFYVSF